MWAPVQAARPTIIPFIDVSRLLNCAGSPDQWLCTLIFQHPVRGVQLFDRVPKLSARAAYAKQEIRDTLMEHKAYIARHGDDMPEMTGWKWREQTAASVSGRSTKADNV